MGMTIEDIEQWARQNNYTIVADNWWEAAQDRINKYQQLQADYENRLKADLKAILVELQMEIKEMDSGCGWEGYADKNVIDCIIQERINSLKGE